MVSQKCSSSRSTGKKKWSISGDFFKRSSLDGVGDGSPGDPFPDGVVGDPSVPDIGGSGSVPSVSS